MEDYAVYETDWEELNEITKINLTVTGYAAIDHVTGERALEEQEGIVCYANVPDGEFEDLKQHLSNYEISIPEPGPQELYVIHGEPPLCHMVEDVAVAEPDTLLRDAITSDPRKFRKDVKHNTAFRDFIQDCISDDEKQDLLDTYSEDDYIAHELSELINSL